MPSRVARLPRMSNPPQSRCTKFVEPCALSTPVALAGPGVSRPATATSASHRPTCATALFRPSTICWRQTSGPSLDRAGCSHSPSIKNCSCGLCDGAFQTVYDLLEADLGSLLGSGGMLAQPFD